MTARNAPLQQTMDAVLVEVGGALCLIPTATIVTIVAWGTSAGSVLSDPLQVGQLDDGTPILLLSALLYHDSAAPTATITDYTARVLLVRALTDAGEREIGLAVERIVEITRVNLVEMHLAPPMIVPRTGCPVTWAFWQSATNAAPVPIIDLRAALETAALTAYFKDEVVA